MDLELRIGTLQGEIEELQANKYLLQAQVEKGAQEPAPEPTTKPTIACPRASPCNIVKEKGLYRNWAK